MISIYIYTLNDNRARKSFNLALLLLKNIKSKSLTSPENAMFPTSPTGFYVANFDKKQLFKPFKPYGKINLDQTFYKSINKELIKLKKRAKNQSGRGYEHGRGYKP